MTAAKQPVKTKDLWAQLDELRENKNIEWKWVKGHSDNKYNNMVDEIARKAVNSED
jgi:Ribonuclease HI